MLYETKPVYATSSFCIVLFSLLLLFALLFYFRDGISSFFGGIRGKEQVATLVMTSPTPSPTPTTSSTVLPSADSLNIQGSKPSPISSAATIVPGRPVPGDSIPQAGPESGILITLAGGFVTSRGLAYIRMKQRLQKGYRTLHVL